MSCGSERFKPILIYDDICNMFNINTENGCITRKYKPKCGCKHRSLDIGDEIGYKDELGYVRIRIKGHVYLRHHIAWLLYYGYYPEQSIDHIHGIVAGDGIWNLRLSSQQQNNGNRSLNKNTKTGYKGVAYRYSSNRKKHYIARLTYNGCKLHIGAFDTANDAANAYNIAAIEWFGEFAKLNVVEL